MPIGTNKIVFTFIQQVFTKCLPASATGLGSQCFRFNEKGKDSHRTPPHLEGHLEDRHNEIITNANVTVFAIPANSTQPRIRPV